MRMTVTNFPVIQDRSLDTILQDFVGEAEMTENQLYSSSTRHSFLVPVSSVGSARDEDHRKGKRDDLFVAELVPFRVILAFRVDYYRIVKLMDQLLC